MMKTNFIRYSIFYVSTMLISTLLLAQVGPDYRFTSPTLVSGTALQTGAIYRFPTVKTGFDALVEIKFISSGTTITNIDRTADGYSEAFQPEVNVSGYTDGYADFKITFVNAGSSIPALQTNVDASALDIDGRENGSENLYEYNQIDMGGGYYDFNTTSGEVVVSTIGTAYKAMNIMGIMRGAYVDTAAHDNMFTVTSNNISSFTFRAGANNETSGASTRYSSLYFMKFIYDNPVPLALPNIHNFQGSKNGNHVTLSWKMDTSEDLMSVLLERTDNGKDYVVIGDFYSAKQTSLQNHFTDDVTNSGNVSYRLKLVSLTGEIKYSNILVFRIGDDQFGKTLEVYPSVFTTQFTAKVNSTVTEEGILQMIDLSGRIVYHKQVKLQVGVNNISVNDINIHSKGNFIIAFRSGSSLLTRKVIAL